MVKKNDYFKIKEGKICVKIAPRGTGRMKAALEMLETVKNDLEYALKYADYAWHRGSIGEQRNMIALAGVAKENAERAAKRIEIAVQMINGNLGPLIGSRGCGKTPPEFHGQKYDLKDENKTPTWGDDEPEYQEEKK